MGAARATTLALYRALLGPLRGKEPLRIRLPVKLSKAQWLSGSQSDKTPPSHAQVIRQLFPVVQAEGDGELWGGPEMWGDDPGELSPERARAIVGAKFREPAASSGSVATRLNDAFAALRALNEQAALGQRTAVTRTTPTEGICVCVEASCDSHGKKETTGQTLWLYQYRIRIRNEGVSPVHLLGREWIIQSADGRVHAHVAKGSPGVVGEQPLLLPGQSFEYASGTTLPTETGSIQGSFQMVVPRSAEARDKPAAESAQLFAFDASVGPLPLRE